VLLDLKNPRKSKQLNLLLRCIKVALNEICNANCINKMAESPKELSQSNIRGCIEGWKARREQCVASNGSDLRDKIVGFKKSLF